MLNNFDISAVYTNQKCFIIASDDLTLLGVLNSSVTFFLFRQILPKLRGDFYEPSYLYFKDFPIPTIPDPKPLAALVQQMLDAQAKLRTAGSDFERGHLQQSIARLDGAIDALVYGLYGLTAEEIRIVEGA